MAQRDDFFCRRELARFPIEELAFDAQNNPVHIRHPRHFASTGSDYPVSGMGPTGPQPGPGAGNRRARELRDHHTEVQPPLPSEGVSADLIPAPLALRQYPSLSAIVDALDRETSVPAIERIIREAKSSPRISSAQESIDRSSFDDFNAKVRDDESIGRDDVEYFIHRGSSDDSAEAEADDNSEE